LHRLNSRLTSLALVTVVLCVSVFCQQKSAPADPPKDAFVGKWRLNVEKSSLPPERETITIEPQGIDYKISCDVAYGNGTELSFWTVTDMKGTVSKVTQSNGKPMNEEWRVTREAADAFVVDSRPFHTVVRYTVSAEGQTLTKREVSSDIIGGKIEKGTFKRIVHILVFDKVR
jgi:hypothetical protein